MKKTFMYIVMMLMTICAMAQVNYQDGVKSSNPSTGEVIYAENVIDFIYNPDDGRYMIEYYDHGILPESNDADNEILVIECNKEDFYGYLAWYEEHKNDDYPCNKYRIVEIPSNNTLGKYVNGDYYRYFLVKG